MIIYNYDPITKEYIGESQADLDPEETKQQGKEVYLIPACATDVKPPKPRTNETVIYNDGWQIIPDFRGKYIVNKDMNPEIVEEIGAIPEGYVVITENQANKIKEDKLYYIISDGKLIKNPNYEEQKAQIREAEFNSAFFNTSLGYIRRAVTMANGSKKDFLSDLLPAIFASVSAGRAVNIIAYDKPPFTEDVTDWTQYQNQVIVTPQFIQECFLQLSNDFLPINEE